MLSGATARIASRSASTSTFTTLEELREIVTPQRGEAASMPIDDGRRREDRPAPVVARRGS